MTEAKNKIQGLIRDSRQAVREFSRRMHLVKAWELLQERDNDGNPKGPLPYTDGAISEFYAAYSCNRDDIDVIHHLAIAHHARAWDRELGGELEKAAQDWEKALEFWYTLGRSGIFRTRMEKKLIACDENADPAFIDGLSRNLIDNLVDIHVDFICFYYQGNHPENVETHLRIVQRAQIAPAKKKKLVDKVYNALTESLIQATAGGSYSPALDRIDYFLTLFPDYLPALRKYTELCREWISHLSILDNWKEVLTIINRAEPRARAMAEHEDFLVGPLEQTALSDLAEKVIVCIYDKSTSFFSGYDHKYPSVVKRDGAIDELCVGINWGRFSYSHCPSESDVIEIFPHILAGRAALLLYKARDVIKDQNHEKDSIQTALDLYRRSIEDLAEAVEMVPEEDVLRENLQAIRNEYILLETMQSAIPGWSLED